MTTFPNPPPSPSDDPANISDWEIVFVEAENGLAAFLKNRMDQATDVEDCLQTVFLKAIASGSDVPPAARKAWLFRVAANESINFWRRRKSSREFIERLSQTLEESSDFGHSPHRGIQQDETRLQLQQHIKTLPESTQQIIRLRFESGQTFQQIATELGLPLGTVLTQMRRGLEKLRNKLQQENE